jgi:hypothetical protein
MSQSSNTIPKHPVIEPAADFYRLRRDGIGFIEKMGGQLWTDYNTHDPGITILEALCYAITDLAYRIGWDIKDILAPVKPSSDALHPYPDQAFFTAREILTINPVTRDDFRRLLIDLEKVRNTWIFQSNGIIDSTYYAWYENDGSQLQRMDFQKPKDSDINSTTVTPKGLYEVHLELEDDPELGDLNDRKIEYKEVFHGEDGSANTIIMEFRFPEITLCDKKLSEVVLSRMGLTKNSDDNLFSLDEKLETEYIRKNWRSLFYLDFTVPMDDTSSLQISNASLRIFVNSPAVLSYWLTKIGGARGWRTLFQEGYAYFFIQQFHKKEKAAQSAVMKAKEALWSHRNLDEDFYRVTIIGIEDVAVCAEVEVKPDADIEWVQAKIWFEIEQYFNPPIRFYTVNELMESGELVEEVFNGPELECGFIRADDLEKAALITELRTSDIINSLMEIEGVVSVSQVLLTKFDAEGNVVKGCADPDKNGEFDQTKASALWLLRISEQQQPRLYRNASRFLFFKNAFPFLPRMDEALDALNQLRGEAERPKNKNADKEPDIPEGTFRNPEEYFSMQNSFPLVYGIGLEGLPANASEERRAQAKQLKAYLCVFEQILANAFSQLNHTADLFSLDPAIKQTSFVKVFSEQLIQGFNDIRNDLYTAERVEAITESLPDFLERRNRFLDHLLARFGEQFSEYALLLSKVNGKKVALERLIDDKISFLKAYPLVSHDRAKAFDYSRPAPFNSLASEPGKRVNESGIKKRISLLLGYPDLAFFFSEVRPAYGAGYTVTFALKDRIGKIWIDGKIKILANSPVEAETKAVRALLVRMNQVQDYSIVHKQKSGHFKLLLAEKKTKLQAACPLPFSKKSDAELFKEELLAWSANERMIVVEHLLLRPKFPGDALYPVGSEAGCSSATCGDEDPYSFRLTFVMPGWTKLYNENLNMRRFAERTIREEIPSHLLGKICWVGNDGFIDNVCNDVIETLAGILCKNGLESSGSPPSENDVCACAKAIYKEFNRVFRKAYNDKTLNIIHPDTIKEQLARCFGGIKSDAVNCSAMFNTRHCWTEVQQTMLTHFLQIALHGWQFDRFENAWFSWLEANAEIDWTEERLRERVCTMLSVNADMSQANESDISQCATKILIQCGIKFYRFIKEQFKADLLPKNPDEFDLPGALFEGINCKDTAGKIKDFLKDRFNSYREVSYLLWIVVNQLSSLRNIYPIATLHDCDDGSDQNPVRLNNTALGNLPSH